MNEIKFVKQFLSELSAWEMLAAQLDDEIESIEDEGEMQKKFDENHELAKKELAGVFQKYLTAKAIEDHGSNLEAQCYKQPPGHSAAEIAGMEQNEGETAVLLTLPNSDFPTWQRKYIVGQEDGELKISGLYVLYPKKGWVREDF